MCVITAIDLTQSQKRLPPAARQSVISQRLETELLSSLGIISNFITTSAGRSRNPPRIVQIVACIKGSLAKSNIATSGQHRRAALATQYGDINFFQPDLSQSGNMLINRTGGCPNGSRRAGVPSVFYKNTNCS